MASMSQTGFLPPQSILHGRYSIVDAVGSGGMGSVYRALDLHDYYREVAIKEMSQGHLQPDRLVEAQALFQQEATLLGSLSHPNLPRVYDSFSEGGRSYLVMDFIKGKTLEQMMQQNGGRPLPLGQVLKYALQLCDVLAYLHTRVPPIIFRDLKPANVMVDAQDTVYLIDFGIARLFKPGQLHDTTSFGSVGFASPEQYGRQQTDPRSDLYSLGATLYYCLTGKHPADNRPTPFHFVPLAQDYPQFPRDLSALLLELVATRPEQRPSSATVVRRRLQLVQQQAVDATINVAQVAPSPNPFYDDQTARAAQFQLQLGRYPGLVRFLGGAGGHLLPWLAFIYGWISARLALAATLSGAVLLSAAVRLSRLTWRNLRSLSFTPPVWTGTFVGGWLTLLFGMCCFSLFLLRGLSQPPTLVAFYLCILLFLVLLRAGTRSEIRHQLARTLLFATMLPLLISAIALQSLPEVQGVLQAVTLNQLLIVALCLLLLISLLWPGRTSNWTGHIVLAVVAFCYALDQMGFGASSLLVLSPQLLSMNVDLVGGLAALTLLLIALIALFRGKQPFTAFDRVLVLLVAVSGYALHNQYGAQEATLAPFLAAWTTSPGNLMLLNHLFAAGPIVVALLWLFIAPGVGRVGRISVYVLALSCCLLQNILGGNIVLPLPVPYTYVLGTSMSDLMHADQALVYALLLFAIAMLLRLKRSFAVWDHIALFGIVSMCALMYSSLQGATGELMALNQLLGQVFVVIVICIALCAGLLAFLVLMRQFRWGNRLVGPVGGSVVWLPGLLLRLERLGLLFATVAVGMVLWFFAHNAPVLDVSAVVAGSVITENQLVLFVLVPGALIALVRLAQPFGWFDRLLLCVDGCLCVYVFAKRYVSMFVFHHIQLWSSGLHLTLPAFCIALGLGVAALLSFAWRRRIHTATDRAVLTTVLGIACACALLAFVWSPLALPALLLLIQGVVLAAHIERVSG